MLLNTLPGVKLGSKLKAWRLEHGFTQDVAAAILGIRQGTYSKLENDQLDLTLAQYCFLVGNFDFPTYPWT